MNNQNVVLIGPPGSGKGEQAALLEQKLRFKIISVGELLRAEVVKKSVIGKRIVSVMNSGRLVDSKIADHVVKKAMKKKSGYVIDGYPREVEEAKVFVKFAHVSHVIVFDVPRDVLIKRLSNRFVCQKCEKIYAKALNLCSCGGKLIRRKDDHPSAVKKRLALYKKETMPVIAFFKKENIPVYHINGNCSIRKVFVSVQRVVRQ